MTVETDIEDARWADAGIARLAEAAAAATLAHLGLDPADYEIGLLATDDARIADLNATFRQTAAPTNVLSWPSVERRPGTPGVRPVPPGPDTPELGDIAIAYETCAREAADAGRTLADHTTHLLVHGTLHLLGYDHNGDADARLMEGTEIEVLATLGVADPY